MEWLNDLDIATNLTLAPAIISMKGEREFLEKLSADQNSFAIVARETDELIGNCGFLNVDNVNRKAELGIFIGDKKYWNQGYGRETIELLLDFGFNVRNFHSVMLIVREFNHRAIKCYEKCGFKRIGVRREACIFGDQKYGEIYMDILAGEFRGKVIGKILEDKEV